MELEVDPSFRTDVITKSIAALRQANTDNERKLAEAIAKRRSLENKHETVLSKLTQVSETHNKMLETSRLAQYKVTQLQAGIDCKHTTNDEVHKRISQINATHKMEEMRQLQETEIFQKKLSSLTEMFRNAKDFYAKHSMLKEIDLVGEKQQNLLEEGTQTNTEENRLTGLMEALEIVARTQDMSVQHQEIPVEVQHQTLDIFQQEFEMEEMGLNKVKEEEAFLLGQLEE